MNVSSLLPSPPLSVVTVQFAQTALPVSEGNPVTAQVELSLNSVTLDRNVVVTLETVDGTATGVVYDVQAIYLYNVHVDVEGFHIQCV